VTTTPDLLAERVQAAIGSRRALLSTLHAEGTDCYRLLHGIAEGAPGITVDRYGPLLLVQTFREPLPAEVVLAVQRAANDALGVDLPIVCNHRGAPPAHPIAEHTPDDEALAEHECREGLVLFLVQARHRGQDPWLFLDLRAGRRIVRSLAAGKSVLNLFAYTCGVGLAACAGGARRVVNVDFAASALEVGARSAARNGFPAEQFSTLHSDCLPVLRQLAGIPVQRRGKHVPYVRIAREAFDLIVLDPPRLAKSAFGTIDVVTDYQSLWKPCLLSLADGGAALVTNHVPTVAEADWHAMLRRCAEKAGRPLRSLEPIAVDADFPSFDGRPPLKLALCRV
jgi:23S rRNA (cytosine1962-C5)-methyltransferase